MPKLSWVRCFLFTCSTRTYPIRKPNAYLFVLTYLCGSEKEYFKIMILYIYTGTVKVVSSQAIPLLSLANDYGVIPLRESCGEAIGSTLESGNIFFLLHVADKFSCKSLRTACGRYLAENFGDLMEQDRLMQLDVDTWVEMLKNDEIKVKSEYELLKYVVHFAKQFKEKGEMISTLEKMLPNIRFPFLPAEMLVEIENDSTFKGVKCLKDLLFEAYKYKAIPEIMKKNGPSRRKFVEIFTWNSDSALTISDDGCTVTKIGGNGWNLKVVGSVEFDSGNPSWEISLGHINHDRSGLVIGIAPKDHPVSSFDQCVGIGMSGGMYKTIHKGGSASSAQKVKVEVDFLSKNVQFSLDKVLYATGHFEWKEIVPVVFMHYTSDTITASFNGD